MITLFCAFAATLVMTPFIRLEPGKDVTTLTNCLPRATSHEPTWRSLRVGGIGQHFRDNTVRRLLINDGSEVQRELFSLLCPIFQFYTFQSTKMLGIIGN